MNRFWIRFSTELKAWRHDPITAVGGFVPRTVLAAAVGFVHLPWVAAPFALAGWLLLMAESRMPGTALASAKIDPTSI